VRPIPLWGPPAVLLLSLLAGCKSASDTWQMDDSELIAQANAVIDSVAALPECAGVTQGGLIHWRAEMPLCPPYVGPARGCSHPGWNPRRIDVVIQSAWNSSENPNLSTLAHELCHMCGYTDEREAEACAQRSHAYFAPVPEEPLGRPPPPPDAGSSSSSVTAALVQGAGRLAADAVRRGDRGQARQLLEQALQAIVEPPAEQLR